MLITSIEIHNIYACIIVFFMTEDSGGFDYALLMKQSIPSDLGKNINGKSIQLVVHV